jgi:hypothetical protein
MSFEEEWRESNKIPVQPPDRIDGISKLLIGMGVLLWIIFGYMLYKFL